MFLIHKFNCQCYHNIETITNILYRALFTIFPYIEYKVYPLCWVAVEPLQTPFVLSISSVDNLVLLRSDSTLRRSVPHVSEF